MSGKWFIWIIAALLALLFLGLIAGGVAALMYVWPVTVSGTAPEPVEQVETTPEADPQRLLIPRWFLVSMTVDGRVVEIPAGQQEITLQFDEDGKANGTGGCNSFFTTYQVGMDGQMRFGEIGATKMACESMALETDFFQALAKVERFNTENFQLALSSADGSTTLVFAMPPK